MINVALPNYFLEAIVNHDCIVCNQDKLNFVTDVHNKNWSKITKIVFLFVFLDSVYIQIFLVILLL